VAQFFTNFSEYTTGVAPADWTARWVTSNVTYTVQADAGATGGKVLRAVVTSTARHAISWDDVGDQDHVEVLLKMRVSTIGTDVSIQGPIARGSGAAASETGYAVVAISASVGLDRLDLREFNAGAFSDTQATGSMVWTANTWYWVRVRANGTSFAWHMWEDGEAEGGTFAEQTDATTASGWAGLLAATAATHEFDIFSVGTNGDAAPSSAPSSGGRGSGGKGKGGQTPNPGEPPKKPLRTSLNKSWKWDRGWR
jgi:hypothetical protein